MTEFVEFDATMHGISKMYVHQFEKLGWMVLAMSKGDKEKPKHYVKTCKHLLKIMEKKEKNGIKNKDKMHDLDIMKKNIQLLIHHAEKDFINNMQINYTNIKIKNNNDYKKVVEYDATVHGLYKWYDSMISKLGWMVIVHHHKNQSKLNEYINTLMKLYKSIDSREKILHDSDKKHDMNIMKENVLILIKHAKHDFA